MKPQSAVTAEVRNLWFGDMRLTPVLISSPFLGPSAWAAVAAELRQGFDLGATTIALSDSDASDPVAILAALRKQLPQHDNLLFVAHSNAGLYVPSLSHETSNCGAVFVDAILPPSRGAMPVAPQGLRDWLTALADPSGLLPSWSEWWPAEVVTELFPDAETRRQVEAEQRQLPLSYLDSQIEVPDGWDQIPAAYLAFGDAYAEELGDARSRGWPTGTMDGNHLHLLWEPAAVASEIMRLAAAF